MNLYHFTFTSTTDEDYYQNGEIAALSLVAAADAADKWIREQWSNMELTSIGKV